MGRSVLVVDDDGDVRQMLCMYLKLKGFHTAEAVDGVDALDKVDRDRPDVVVLDVMMPRLDGIQVCRRLRQQAATAALPIIMLSGRTGADAVAEGLRAGANRYLLKPARLEDLSRSINELTGADVLGRLH